jgi:hypothetical protein
MPHVPDGRCLLFEERMAAVSRQDEPDAAKPQVVEVSLALSLDNPSIAARRGERGRKKEGDWSARNRWLPPAVIRSRPFGHEERVGVKVWFWCVCGQIFAANTAHLVHRSTTP